MKARLERPDADPGPEAVHAGGSRVFVVKNERFQFATDRRRASFGQDALGDVAIVDVPWNGAWQSMKIAALAEAHDVNVAPHNFYGHLCTMMNAHFAAAVPNLRIMEIDVDRLPWDKELFTHEPEFENGHLIIPDRPGWGTDPIEEAILAHPPKVTGGLLQYKRS